MDGRRSNCPRSHLSSPDSGLTYFSEKYRSARAAKRSRNPIIRKVLQNVVPTILTLRLSREKFLISLGWNAAVAIDIAAAKLQIQMVPVGIVCDRGQHPRLHPNPVHIPAPLTHSRKSSSPNSTVFSCRATCTNSYACLPKATLRLQKNPPRNPCAHLDAPDGAEPDFVEMPHQAQDLVADHEICQGEFRPRSSSESSFRSRSITGGGSNVARNPGLPGFRCCRS